MAKEDLIVKEVMQYFAIPLVVAGFVYILFSKKMSSSRKKFGAWIMDRFLKRMHRRLQTQKDIVFSDIKLQAKDAQEEGRQLQILEIGSGTGMNFKFFPDGSDLICLDPNPYNKTYLEKNRNSVNPNINLKECIVGYAEDMPDVASSSCDAVVCTLVLCTVKDIDAVIGEIKRVLKPGGVFYYVEHVAARNGFSRKFQNFVNPAWKMCSGNCHLNRETWVTLNNAKFSAVQIEHFNLSMWKIASLPLIYGKAVK